MDSYGVITIGNHLLSLVGLVVYLGCLTVGFWLVYRLVSGIPQRYRILNYVVYLAAVVAIVSWGFKLLGLDFYVEA